MAKGSLSSDGQCAVRSGQGGQRIPLRPGPGKKQAGGGEGEGGSLELEARGYIITITTRPNKAIYLYADARCAL